MADNKVNPDPKSWWESTRTWIGEQWKVIGVTGAFGYVIWALAQDDESKQAFLEAVNFAGNLFNKANRIYQKLRRGLMAVVGIVVTILLVMLYQGYHMPQLWTEGPLFYTIQHSRGIVELLIGLSLFGLLLDFSLRILPALFGADFLSGRFSKPMPGEGYLEKTLRLVGKFKGWVALGIVLLTIAPWHNDPRLLVMASASISIWPFFCNAWRPGQNEHFRRSLLWLTGLLKINLIGLAAAFYWIGKVDELFMNPDKSAVSLSILVFWILQVVLAFYMGWRRTEADEVRGQLTPIVVADQVAVDITDLDKAKALLSAAGFQPKGGSRDQHSSGGHLTAGERILAQPRGMHPFVKAMIGLGVFGVVGLAAGIFNKVTLVNKPFVPYEWLFDGNQSMNVLTWGLITVGIVGIIIGALSQSNAKFK